jgi:hypothetical protein
LNRRTVRRQSVLLTDLIYFPVKSNQNIQHGRDQEENASYEA